MDLQSATERVASTDPTDRTVAGVHAATPPVVTAGLQP